MRQNKFCSKPPILMLIGWVLKIKYRGFFILLVGYMLIKLKYPIKQLLESCSLI